MSDNNIEFSSIPVTKALHEAIKGVVDITGETEEDFIHWSLALMVGRVILRNFEFVHLSDKSVEEDFESLKHCLSLRDKGKNFVLRWKINSSSDFDVSLEAIEKMRKEFDLGEDFFNVPSSFELLFRNIANEQVCSNIKYEGLSDLLEGKITLEEHNAVVEEKQEKYRVDKRYLKSEIPFAFISEIYSSLIDPSLLSQIEHLLVLAKTIESGKFTTKEVILFFFLLRSLFKTPIGPLCGGIKYFGVKRFS